MVTFPAYNESAPLYARSRSPSDFAASNAWAETPHEDLRICVAVLRDREESLRLRVESLEERFSNLVQWGALTKNE